MFDLIIIGCGPSGMSCALYATRAGKKVLILEKGVPGGQMILTNHIQNYPSLENIDGATLATNMFEQITNLGVNVIFEEVISCDITGKIKSIVTTNKTYESYAVFIATGASARQLEVSNEKKYISKGLSYCATCDGAFFKNKPVAVVGGGNSSFEDVLYLSSITDNIYLIHRRSEFRGDSINLDKIKKLENDGKVKILTNCVVTNIIGNSNVEKIEIKNILTNELTTIDVSALFVAIGRKPDTDIFAGQVEIDEHGYIKTNENMQTSVSGVYCGGDVRTTNLRQIVTACSDGAIAGTKIAEYINSNK